MSSPTPTDAQNNGGISATDTEASLLGISPAGEPVDSLTPLSRRIASLPLQRRVDFRLGQDGQPILKDLMDGTRNIAAWAQTRGVQAGHRCSHCASGRGPFMACVVLKNHDGQLFFEGSCANCQFHRQGSKCSFRAVPAASDTISPDKLLKDFQSASNSGSQKHREPQSLPKPRRKSSEKDETYEPPVHKRRRMNNPSSSPTTAASRPRPAQPRPDNNQAGVPVPATPATATIEPTPSGPSKSKADGMVLQCPLTLSLFNDAAMLRQAIQDLSTFMRLARGRLRKLEQSPDAAMDLWGGAMEELQTEDE